MSEHETLVVIQATTFCNIDCSYCYLPHRNRRSRLSLETAELIFQRVFESRVLGRPIAFLWHLGEPLVLPVEFYEAAFARCKLAAGDIPYMHSFQTNATLLDATWIELLRRHKVRLGVSIDGPAFLHDEKRRTRSGRGTHTQVMRGIRLLQQNNIPFSVISVLTERSLAYPDAIFDFFLENGMDDVAFNLDEIEGVNAVSSFAGTDDPRESYKRFLERILERIDVSDGAVKVREIWKTARSLTDGKGDIRNTTNAPFQILNVKTNGDFSTYCPELITADAVSGRSFILGNLSEISIDEAATSNLFEKIEAEVAAGRELCRAQCEYWDFCGGGSPSNKFFEFNRLDVAETLTCRVHLKTTVDVVAAYLQRHLNAGIQRPV